MANLNELNFAGIYQILNLVDGKRYIGQAQNIQSRIYEHQRKRNKGYLYRAIEKYGWDNFDVSVIEKVDDISELDEKEQFWLDLFQSYLPSNGYNICKIAGTTRGRQHTEATKQKIKETIPDKHGANNPFYGKAHTAETRAKISKSRTGSTYQPEVAEKRWATMRSNGKSLAKAVIQFSPSEQVIIKVWDSATAASESGFTLSSISQCCNGKRKLHKGFGWRFANI